jgi:lipopolysaccharide assembly outer membrane protein LptD (OstA)
MGKYIKKLLFLLIIIFLSYGCSDKKEAPQNEISQKSLEKFTFRQFADKTAFTLTGESAEVSEKNDTFIKSPSLSLTTSVEIIEITTGKEGKGEFNFLPDTKKINKVLFTGNVKIFYKELSTGKTNMQGNCKKLTYLESNKMLIMEGDPTLESGKNKFSGDIIYYNLNDNTLKIEGSVNVQILSK